MISLTFTGPAEFSEREQMRMAALMEVMNLRIIEELREKMALIYGGGMNGLDYADDLFNKLSKGSSYFIPKLKEANKNFQGRNFNAAVTITMPAAGRSKNFYRRRRSR
jgi:hypothetical protein